MASSSAPDPPDYVVTQLGGGRRRSPSPVHQTPTRLRPRRHAANSDEVRKTPGPRSKSRFRRRTSVAAATTNFNKTDDGSGQSTVPACIPNASRALPPLPAHSSSSRQSSLTPIDPDGTDDSGGLTVPARLSDASRALPPLPAHSSSSRQSSLAPIDPNGTADDGVKLTAPACLSDTSRALPPLPARTPSSRQLSLAPPSRQPSLAPPERYVPPYVHPVALPAEPVSLVHDHPSPLSIAPIDPSSSAVFAGSHGPSLPPSTTTNGTGTPALPYLSPIYRQPSLPPNPSPALFCPPSRPPSAVPTTSMLTDNPCMTTPAVAAAGQQLSRVHPVPPAGPRKPSGSHAFPPPSDHQLPFTRGLVCSGIPDGHATETEEVITIRPFVPITRVIPPTPQDAGLRSSASGSQDIVRPADPIVLPGEAHSENEGASVSATDQPPTPTTPSNGRRSAGTQAALDSAFEEMDAVLDRVSAQTSISHQLVLDIWNKSRGRIVNGINHWNIYQGYFKANEEQERGRINIAPAEPGTPSIMSRCYKQFISDYGCRWKDVLEVYELVEITRPGPGQTIAQRTQTFNNFSHRITDMLDMACKRHGFEAALVMCGKVVSEDSGLACAHTTAGAQNFWEDRCRATRDMIIGHLRAHVYSVASLQVVDKAFATDNEDRATICAMDVAPDSHTNMAALPLQDAKAAPQPDVVIGNESDTSLPPDHNTNPTNYIKSSFTRLVRECGVDTTKLLGGNFPWKNLLGFFVEKGLIMEGYPHDVLMPGQVSSETARTKGLNNLSLPQKRRLVSCLHARQVTLKRVANSRELAALSNNQLPVVLDEAPPPTFHRSHGRRQFGNGKIDHKGLPRMKEGLGLTRVKKGTSHGKKVRYVEVTDDSSPAVIRRVSKSKGEVIEIQSDTDDDSGSASAQSDRDGGSEVPKKRKANPPRREAVKRIKHQEQRDKGKAVAREVVDSSDDEELLSGRILTGPSSNEVVRPKPRVIHRQVKVEDCDVFHVAGPSRASVHAVTETLKKDVPQPNNIPIPSSPSPPCRVLEPPFLEVSGSVQKALVAPHVPQQPPVAPEMHPVAPTGFSSVTATISPFTAQSVVSSLASSIVPQQSSTAPDMQVPVAPTGPSSAAVTVAPFAAQSVVPSLASSVAPPPVPSFVAPATTPTVSTEPLSAAPSGQPVQPSARGAVPSLACSVAPPQVASSVPAECPQVVNGQPIPAQPHMMGNLNGYFFPNGSCPQYSQPFFGPQGGMPLRGMGYHDNQGTANQDAINPYSMFRGNTFAPGVYQGTGDLAGQYGMYLDYAKPASGGTSTLPHLPAPPHQDGKPTSQG